MFASFFRALLLVAVVGVVCAHGRVHRLKNKVLVTSSSAAALLAAGDAAGGINARRNLLSLDCDVEKDDVSVAGRAASSVVQDWSLVCKQLCGAGIGGVPCVAHCSSTAEKAAKNVSHKTDAAILNPNKDLICQDLCGLQLGGVGCNCTVDFVVVSAAPPTDNHNAVCSSFCDRNGATLVGCSLCRNEVTDRPSALTAGDDGGAENGDGGANVYIVTATAAATGTRTGAPIITTTPNWDVLCVSLCKTGDGGSLCNCDLSPFFN